MKKRFYEDDILQYPPINEWSEAQRPYNGLLLENGEYVVIASPHNGRGICLVARIHNENRYHPYLESTPIKEDGFTRVSLAELNERSKSFIWWRILPSDFFIWF